MQNASICANIKIESIFQLFALKKNKRILLLIIKIDNAKMANMLIKEGLVLDYICIRYNFAYKIR